MGTINKLQRQEILKEDILKLKFTKTLYKTITEILAQTDKTNKEKLEEWFEIEREHKWLVDMKLDAWIWLTEARKEKWYNKIIEEEKDAIVKCILSGLENEAKWNYTVIKNL